MSKTSSRGLALAALQRWRASEQFADAILGQLLRASDLAAPDRAFATELFYGVLRNLMLLDFWIDSLRSRHLDHDTRDLLRLGYVESRAHDEVAAELQISPSNARVLRHRTLASLRGCMSKRISWEAA